MRATAWGCRITASTNSSLAWDAVCAHVVENVSELLLAPQMVSWQWLAATADVDGERWRHCAICGGTRARGTG